MENKALHLVKAKQPSNINKRALELLGTVLKTMTIMIKTTNQLMKDTEEMLGVQCLCHQNEEFEEF